MRTRFGLTSALGRLRVAVFIVEQARTLRPFNKRAEAIFEAESLRWDLLEGRPSHPLASLVTRLLAMAPDQEPQAETIAFPSGTFYRVEASRPSAKGRERPLMLLIEPVADQAVAEVLREWSLTEREKEIARALIEGAGTDQIGQRLGITGNTLKTHLRNIFSKSGVTSRTEFLTRFLRRRS